MPESGEVRQALLPAVSSEHSGSFLRLAQLWQHGGHFSLLLAAIDDSVYREALVGRLQELAPAVRIDLSADDSPLDWLLHLEQARAAGASRVQVCMPISPRRSDGWWQRVNVLRERMADAFSAPQLVWLSDADVDAAAHQAPDWWNWRDGVFGFCMPAVPSAKPTAPEPRFAGSSAWEASDVRRRLQSIDAALARMPEGEAASAHLLLESAEAHLRLGNWRDAERAASLAAAAFQQSGNASLQAQAQAQVAEVQWRTGDPEQSLQVLRSKVLPVYERLGDVRSKAITMGQIADILQARGQLDEALRIRQDEQLPVYERLGDVRSKAITMGKIADILQARGQLDEALRIRQDEQLPVYERLGDVHSKAITMGKIADILQARGQLDEALRIRQDEELPVYERLGDVRSKAVTMGKIADILQARGQLDEALRIRQEEQLPVYERLGDVRSKAVTMGQIADILQARGQLDEALRIRQDEELPVYERLGDSSGLAHVQFALARLMLERGDRERGGVQTIYEKLAEAFEISRKSGRVDAIAAIGRLLANIMAMAGWIDDALGVLDQAESAYAALGSEEGLAQVVALREWIEAQRADN